MKHTSIIAAILIALLLAPLTARAAISDDIPFEITESGHMVVTLRLDGREDVKAIVDTGATFPIIDSQSAALIGVTPPASPDMVDIIGLGNVRTFPVIDIGGLTVGPVRLDAPRAAYNDKVRFPSTGNVIPASSLPHRTLDFDFERSRLRVSDRRPAHISRSITTRLEITRIGGLPFVEVSVNGKPGLALIDTGASISVINSAFAEGASRSQHAIRDVELIGATGNVTPLKVLFSRRFEIGDFQVDRFNIIVSDPEFLERFGLAETPVMILGLDVLKAFRLQIDREEELVRLVIPDRGRRPGAGVSLRAR
ncbi:aspartyl protease family protein [Henriciella marina]|uniref:Aspartyl protease family protein n=1 Tax=Henriciella marina TaxID=453851 RepID=A0ABT4LWJ7_9PROT|nr:aspartyl protease family protein [Henriciella marina]MCZ4297524.1 aspartyl protease family protein [Henriciella marina]